MNVYHDVIVKVSRSSKKTYDITITIPKGARGVDTVNALDREALEEQLEDATSQGDHALQSVGSELYRFLLPEPINNLFHRARGIDDRPIRLRIELDDPSLQHLPWELLYDEQSGQFLSQQTDVLLIRELLRPHQKGSTKSHLPIRVLIAIAQPIDLPKLDSNQELAGIREALQAANLFETRVLKHTTPDTLFSEIKKFKPQVVHYIGHGAFDEQYDCGLLLLEEKEPPASNYSIGIDAKRLAVVFSGSVKLVVLNGCVTGRGSQGDAFTAVGPAMVAAGVPAVIAMQNDIEDQQAIRFAKAFYTALAEGTHIAVALSEARQALSLASSIGTWDWAIPALFMWAEDDILFEKQNLRKKADSPRLTSMTPSSLAPEPQPSQPILRQRDQVLQAEHSVTDSPFIVGPPIREPRHFFGHKRVLRRIFNLFKRLPLQNAAIIGPRRSGKTSLLCYLENITTTPPSELRPNQRTNWISSPERYRWIFVDFQDPRLGSQSGLLRYLLTQLELPVPTSCDLDHFMDVVSHRLHSPTVILMDEIGVALQRYPELDDMFWEGLRSLATNQVGGKLAFVLASHKPLYELATQSHYSSPFFNIFGYTVTLKQLSEEEARELIANSPIPFPADDIEWILTESGRWPILLQILCRERLIALEDGETDDAWQQDGLQQIIRFRSLLETQ